MKNLHPITMKELEQMRRKGITFEQYSQQTGYIPDSVSYEGVRYPIMLSGLFGNLRLWTRSGHHLLGRFTITKDDVPSKNLIRWIEDRVYEWKHGSIHCTRCNKLMSKKDIAGTLLAGVYCKECNDLRNKIV